MEELSPITIFRRNLLFTWYFDSEEECKSLSRLSLERLSLWKSSHLTLSRMSKRRSRTRKEFPQINNDLSSLESNSKMDELSLTTIFRRNLLFTWYFDFEEDLDELLNVQLIIAHKSQSSLLEIASFANRSSVEHIDSLNAMLAVTCNPAETLPS